MEEEERKENERTAMGRRARRCTRAVAAPTGNGHRVCRAAVSAVKALGLGASFLLSIASIGVCAMLFVPPFIDWLETPPATYLYCQGHSRDGDGKSFVVVVQQKRATSIRADIRAFNARELHRETVNQRETINQWDEIELEPEYHWEERNSSVNSILFYAWNGGLDHDKALQLNRYTGEMKIRENSDAAAYSFEGTCTAENERKF